MRKKFKLFECCIPVKGASRSTLCDVQRGKIKFIPNLLCEILSKYDGQEKEAAIAFYGPDYEQIIHEYYDFLVENEFGFWTDHPEWFPKMDLTWESPSAITNGIIDVNKNSDHNFRKIFGDYEQVHCKHLQLRFFDAVEIEFLSNNLKYLEKSVVSSVELILKFTEETTREKLKELGKEHPRIHRILVHSSPEFSEALKISRESPVEVVYFVQVIDSSAHCGNISMEYFTIEQDTLLESLSFNSCLNKKISIDVNGDIKNCPSMTKSYGNIKNQTLKSVLELPDFRHLWNINKDQIETCKVCEFRYICTDCRAFLESDNSLAKPKKCSYNPYTMKWDD